MALMQIAEPGQSPDPHQKSIVVGIDLGTTHSLVSAVKNSVSQCLESESGESLLPSIVTYTASEVCVGNPINTGDESLVVSSIKRFMGRSSFEVQELLQEFPVAYRWDFSDAKVPKVVTPAGLKSPVEVSSDILKALKQRVIQHFNVDAVNEHADNVIQAVITVPAYFDDAQRQATQDAARLAGIQVLRLINEPTAAALAYDIQEDGQSVVYDFGGGTFDASLISKQGDVFEVVGTTGDTFLGGDDIDQALFQFMTARHPQLVVEGLRVELKAAKELLSSQTVVQVRGLDVTQAELQDVMQPVLKKTHHALKKLLVDADQDWSDINSLLLVGGSTRSPRVGAALEEITGIDPRQDVNPEEVVALGALAQARKMTSNDVQHLLLDVCPLSLGLETMGGIVEKIIQRNTPIPVVKRQVFTTMKNQQSALLLHIVQGERETVDTCRSLAKFELRGLPPLAAGVARIEVEFAIDANGVLSVSAQELSTRTQSSVEVKPSQGLSDDQMLSLLQDASLNAKEDVEQRLYAGAKVELERIIEAADVAFAEDELLLGKQERLEYKMALSQGRMIAADACASKESFDKMREKMNRVTETLAARRMNKAIKAALEGTYIE